MFHHIYPGMYAPDCGHRGRPAVASGFSVRVCLSLPGSVPPPELAEESPDASAPDPEDKTIDIRLGLVHLKM